MIERTIEYVLRKLATTYPLVTLTGQRQSGKTTLCRTVFPDLPYVNLEALICEPWHKNTRVGF